MRLSTLIIFSLLIIPACKKKGSVPGRYIQPDKMELIIRDMMLADQFLADFVLNKDTSLKKRMESTRLYGQVLAIHEVSREDFNQSFEYYRSHPSLFKRIMDSIAKENTSAASPDRINPVIAPQKVEDTVKTAPVEIRTDPPGQVPGSDTPQQRRIRKAGIN